MAMRRGMGGPPQDDSMLPGERSYRGSACLDRPAAACFSSGTMRIPALGLKRKQWEPLAFASPSMALIVLVIVFPLASGRRQVPGGHRAELPVPRPGSGYPGRGRVPAQALVRD